MQSEISERGKNGHSFHWCSSTRQLRAELDLKVSRELEQVMRDRRIYKQACLFPSMRATIAAFMCCTLSSRNSGPWGKGRKVKQDSVVTGCHVCYHFPWWKHWFHRCFLPSFSCSFKPQGHKMVEIVKINGFAAFYFLRPSWSQDKGPNYCFAAPRSYWEDDLGNSATRIGNLITALC